MRQRELPRAVCQVCGIHPTGLHWYTLQWLKFNSYRKNTTFTMTSKAPLTTINDLFCRIAGAGSPRAILWQDEFGHWLPISSDQFYQRVHALSEEFLKWGTQKGDRIGLVSENRWEWAVTDFATLAIGAVDVPIYPTLTGEQIAVLLKDAGCKIAVVSTRQQFEKLNAVRAQTSLERILIMDRRAAGGGHCVVRDSGRSR